MPTDRSKIRVWITKYVFTQGIIECHAELCNDVSDKMIAVSGASYTSHYHKPYWHTSKKAALQHAEELRLKKIKSLRKQISKLEELQFE